MDKTELAGNKNKTDGRAIRLDDREYFTRSEVAEIVRGSISTVDRNIRSGELQIIKIGRKVLIPREALEAFLEKRKVENESVREKAERLGYIL